MNNQDFYSITTISKLCFELNVGTDMTVEVLKYYMYTPKFMSLYCVEHGVASQQLGSQFNNEIDKKYYYFISKVLDHLQKMNIIKNWSNSGRGGSVYIRTHKNTEPKIPLSTIWNALKNDELSFNKPPFDQLGITRDFSFKLVKN